MAVAVIEFVSSPPCIFFCFSFCLCSSDTDSDNSSLFFPYLVTRLSEVGLATILCKCIQGYALRLVNCHRSRPNIVDELKRDDASVNTNCVGKADGDTCWYSMTSKSTWGSGGAVKIKRHSMISTGSNTGITG